MEFIHERLDCTPLIRVTIGCNTRFVHYLRRGGKERRGGERKIKEERYIEKDKEREEKRREEKEWSRKKEGPSFKPPE